MSEPRELFVQESKLGSFYVQEKSFHPTNDAYKVYHMIEYSALAEREAEILRLKEAFKLSQENLNIWAATTARLEVKYADKIAENAKLRDENEKLKVELRSWKRKALGRAE